MERDVIKASLAQFIQDTFIKGRVDKMLGDDDSFLDNEVIDSTGVLELTLFIEQTFTFRVEDDEIVPENLDSLNRLVDFVARKVQDGRRAT